jgi:phage terminase small subunit
MKAGYSEKCAGQQGFENLKKPDILKYIRFKTKPIMEQLGITQERVLRELAAIAFSDITDVFNSDWSLKELQEMDPEKTPAIKNLEKTDRGVKVQLHDKLAALQRLWELVKPNQEANVSAKENFFAQINDYYSRN